MRKTRLNEDGRDSVTRPASWMLPVIWAVILAGLWTVPLMSVKASDIQLAQLGGVANEPGQAPSPNELDAVAIRQGIERWLLDFFPPDSPGGQAVKLSGQVVVEPFGERYAVTLPQMAIDLGSGNMLAIGTVTMSLTPVTPVTYRVAMRLPLPFPIVDADGVEVGRFDMARQRFRGVWDTRFETLTTIEASFTDIVVRNSPADQAPADLLTIGSFELTGESQVDEQLRLSGPSTMTLTNIEVQDQQQNRLTYIERLLIESEARGLDMLSANGFARRFQGLAQAFIPSPDGALPDRETADLLLSQLRRDLLDLPNLLSDFGFVVTVNGLVGNDPLSSRGFSVDEVIYTLLARGFDGAESRMSASYSHSGLMVLPKPAEPDLTPRQISFEIDVEGIPNEELWNIVTDIPTDMSLYGTQPGANFGIEKLFHALAIAETSVSLEKGYINSERLDSRITASALFDNGAAFKTVAAANIRMIGMDELIADMASRASNDPDVSVSLLALRTLQSLGQPGEMIGGRSNREFSLRVEANGNVTLNGQSFAGLIGTFLGGGAGQQ